MRRVVGAKLQVAVVNKCVRTFGNFLNYALELSCVLSRSWKSARFRPWAGSDWRSPSALSGKDLHGMRYAARQRVDRIEDIHHLSFRSGEVGTFILVDTLGARL